MDAKVRPARRVHRYAEEMIALARPARRLETAVESAVQVGDHHPDAAARRRNFPELFPALGRGFRLSAWAGAETANSIGFRAHSKHSAKLRPVESADPGQVVPFVAVGKVVGHPAQAHPVEVRPEAVHLAGATAHRVEVQPAGAEA
jgi:hypothetical protein